MRRGWKILIAVVVALAVLVGLNAVVTDRETKPAEPTVPEGEILDLTGGDLQVLDTGPRRDSPIVLIHCFTCSINWWSGMLPLIERDHRVIAVDLLGHGGSEKPGSGYSIPNQADLVAQALSRLGVREATVVGHSLGAPVAVALAERSPRLVDRLVIMDAPPQPEKDNLGTLAGLAFTPVIGEALWRIKPDFAVRRGLEVAFAPGFDIPDPFIEDVERMTYTAYDQSGDAFDDYAGDVGLDRRVRATGKPLLVIMGDEEQIIADPEAAIAAYEAAVPGALSNLIRGVGHSPNVEEPTLTAKLVAGFAGPPQAVRQARARRAMQDGLQTKEPVRPGS